jgi:hypothetical protein
MSQVACRLMAEACAVIEAGDVDAATGMAAEDDEMDRLRGEVYERLLAAADGFQPGRAMDAALIARYYERLADHAVSVGRCMAFRAGRVGLDPTPQSVGPGQGFLTRGIDEVAGTDGRRRLSPAPGCPGGDQARQQTDGRPTHHCTGQPELVVQDADDAEEHRDHEQCTETSHERAAAVGARPRRIRGSLGHVSTCRSTRWGSGRSS